MKQKNKMKYFCISVVSVCTVILIWFLCINVFHMKSETVFPGPVKVFNTFLDKLHTKAPDGATLQAHLWSSIKVALLGYALGAIVGVPLGIAMAWNKWVDRFVRPLFDLVRPIPGLVYFAVRYWNYIKSISYLSGCVDCLYCKQLHRNTSDKRNTLVGGGCFWSIRQSEAF